jgi:putative SOS response-associated peptidase YedK
MQLIVRIHHQFGSRIMCGRASQTLRAAQEASDLIGASPRKDANTVDRHLAAKDSGGDDVDNYNMCPGMNALVMWKEGGQYQLGRMTWGLLTKNGSKNNPIPTGKQRMSLHFQNLMFNARSDTLFSKPTFSKLTLQKRSCVVALDGYFEWKKSPLAGGKGKKQPYYVYRKDCGKDETKPLLVAGLWTQVSTGIPDEPTLETFTILTTEPCKQIEWLHDRMPLCLWDKKSCVEWLDDPSAKVLKALDATARQNEGFGWHMVSTMMGNLKFRERKAIEAIKAPPSVLSFFSKKGTNSSNSTKKKVESATEKRNEDEELSSKSKRLQTSPAKEKPTPKKAKITSFFQTTS